MSAVERRVVDSLKKAIRLLQYKLCKAQNENTRKSLLAHLNEHLLAAQNLREQLQMRAAEKAVLHVQAFAQKSERMFAVGHRLIQFARTEVKDASRAEAALTMNEDGAEGCSGKMRMTVKALKDALTQRGLDTRGTKDDLLRRLNLASLGEGIPNGAGGASFVAGAAAKPGAAGTSAQSSGGGAAALDAGDDAGEEAAGKMTVKELQIALEPRCLAMRGNKADLVTRLVLARRAASGAAENSALGGGGDGAVLGARNGARDEGGADEAEDAVSVAVAAVESGGTAVSSRGSGRSRSRNRDGIGGAAEDKGKTLAEPNGTSCAIWHRPLTSCTAMNAVSLEFDSD